MMTMSACAQIVRGPAARMRGRAANDNARPHLHRPYDSEDEDLFADVGAEMPQPSA
jgi:hypothetical protein